MAAWATLSLCSRRLLQHRCLNRSLQPLHYRAVTSGSGPFVVVQTAEAFYQTLHEYTHLPWWCVIVSSTVLLRSVVTLPFAVHQHRLLAKMELLMPTLKEYQEAVKHNVIAKCRQENLPLEVANKRMKKEVCRYV